MKKTGLFLIILMGFLAGCVEETVVHEPSEDDTGMDEETAFNGITKQRCREVNGKWNECGSPCGGTDADFCIEMCQVQCECGGIAGFGCPEGFKCRLTGKIADEMGVCISS
ncbi:hypothetical protein ISS05_00280 [Candidatus Woesearchaeota archaeon]|nr:hypothetical protein [Candidatus Woesearchaeota archaeon]